MSKGFSRNRQHRRAIKFLKAHINKAKLSSCILLDGFLFISVFLICAMPFIFLLDTKNNQQLHLQKLQKKLIKKDMFVKENNFNSSAGWMPTNGNSSKKHQQRFEKH